MEHRPEWACESESCAVTQGSLGEENGPRLSKAFSPASLHFQFFLVLLPSNFVSHGFLHQYAPPPPHHHPTMTLSGEFPFHVASCLSAPNYHLHCFSQSTPSYSLSLLSADP